MDERDAVRRLLEQGRHHDALVPEDAELVVELAILSSSFSNGLVGSFKTAIAGLHHGKAFREVVEKVGPVAAHTARILAALTAAEYVKTWANDELRNIISAERTTAHHSQDPGKCQLQALINVIEKSLEEKRGFEETMKEQIRAQLSQKKPEGVQ